LAFVKDFPELNDPELLDSEQHHRLDFDGISSGLRFAYGPSLYAGESPVECDHVVLGGPAPQPN